MKLYNSAAPNPWRVRAYLMEKGASVSLEDVNIQDGGTRTPEFLKINSLGGLPVLELDDGRFLTESIAICRYLDCQFEGPALFGVDPYDQGLVEMWNRRMEFEIIGTVANIAKHSFGYFADKIEQMPEFVENQRRMLVKKWNWLDEELKDGRPFIAGNNFSIADITGMMGLRISEFIETAVPEECVHVKKWERAVRGRASWDA